MMMSLVDQGFGSKRDREITEKKCAKSLFSSKSQRPKFQDPVSKDNIDMTRHNNTQE